MNNNPYLRNVICSVCGRYMPANTDANVKHITREMGGVPGVDYERVRLTGLAAKRAKTAENLNWAGDARRHGNKYYARLAVTLARFARL